MCLMTAATSLISGLDEIVKRGDPKRRAEAARRITELFLERGPQSCDRITSICLTAF